MSDAVDVKRSTTKNLRGQAPLMASFPLSVFFLHEPEFGSSTDIVSGYDGDFFGLLPFISMSTFQGMTFDECNDGFTDRKEKMQLTGKRWV
jgi:hypothetical protein